MYLEIKINRVMRELFIFLMILLPMIGIGQNLETQEKIDILVAHNKYRLDLDLPELVWSSDLANSSKKWADKLISSNLFEHSNTSNGENLFIMIGSDATPIQVVDNWASEKEYFNYKTKKCIQNCCDYVDCCSHECGHYTQIIWRETMEVGCAVSKLGIKQIWVCQYDPPGNYIGEETY